MTPEQAKQLRRPFPPEQIGQLPKANTMLDYVGHAAVTDRLLEVDPEWTWEPFAVNEHGLPLVIVDGNEAVLWIRLTVCGRTLPGVGIVPVKAFERDKQLISDALRNAAMRFGVALDLWSREDLHADPPPDLDAEAQAAGFDSEADRRAEHDRVADVVKAAADETTKEACRAYRKKHGWPMDVAHLAELETLAGGAPFEEAAK